MYTTYCPTKQEVQYYGVDYGFDSIKNILKNYYTLKESVLYKPNFELVSIIADVENAITEAGLTDRQHHILMLSCMGYSDVEIGGIFGTSKQNVNKTISRTCVKISNYLCNGGD